MHTVAVFLLITTQRVKFLRRHVQHVVRTNRCGHRPNGMTSVAVGGVVREDLPRGRRRVHRSDAGKHGMFRRTVGLDIHSVNDRKEGTIPRQASLNFAHQTVCVTQ